MSLTSEQIDILFDASEDCTPLWEAKWEYSRLSDGVPDPILIKQAKVGIDHMLASGLISLCRCSSWIGGTYAPVAFDEAPELIQDIAHWHPPVEEDSSWLCFSATEAGLKYLHENEEVRAYYQSTEFLMRYPDPEWHPMKRS